MAKKKISPELEEAILNLPQKEKNKLLIRLINKDDLLIEQLQYKLLEGTQADLDYRVSTLKDEINSKLKSTTKYYKDLLGLTREAVTSINRFQKVTKDKKGELELLVHLFLNTSKKQKTLTNNLRDLIFKHKYKEYFTSKLTKMNTLLNQLHEDYKVEFEEDLNQLETSLSLL